MVTIEALEQMEQEFEIQVKGMKKELSELKSSAETDEQVKSVEQMEANFELQVQAKRAELNELKEMAKLAETLEAEAEEIEEVAEVVEVAEVAEVAEIDESEMFEIVKSGEFCISEKKVNKLQIGEYLYYTNEAARILNIEQGKTSVRITLNSEMNETVYFEMNETVRVLHPKNVAVQSETPFEIKIDAVSSKKVDEIATGEYLAFGGEIAQILDVEQVDWNLVQITLDSEIFDSIELSTTDTVRIVTSSSFA